MHDVNGSEICRVVCTFSTEQRAVCCSTLPVKAYVQDAREYGMTCRVTRMLMIDLSCIISVVVIAIAAAAPICVFGSLGVSD